MTITNDKAIAAMREFTDTLHEHPSIESAWLDDWDAYCGFNFGVHVQGEITRYSTTKLKAVIRAMSQSERFKDITVNLVEYTAPKRYRGSIWGDTFDRKYWLFSAQINV